MCALPAAVSEKLLIKKIPNEDENSTDRIYRRCAIESTLNTLGFIYSDQIKYIQVVDEIPNHKCSSITSIISFTGNRQLILTINLPRQLAEKFTKDLSGFVIEFETEDMADFVGELANLIAGEFTAKLEKANVHVQMGLPSVIRGQDFELFQNERLLHVTFEFSFNADRFYIKLQTGKDSQIDNFIPAFQQISHSYLGCG